MERLDAHGFEELIQEDREQPRNLFLVAVVDGKIVGFSRCEGVRLQRFAHKVEFGVCVEKRFWGYGIGKNLLKESIAWAYAHTIKKMMLRVVHTNERAIKMYEGYGFSIEGILKNDRVRSNGTYENTVVMGRWHDNIGSIES
ncbi:ribosomal protein S18 acetylase RimI-like enzyme [Aureibacillus halotolerans]|uniref:Ribosomal protein S18 acetylase RimI-like enzyme n=1 Tax=Aureibacillus halotolerans TaxID=1508390 RepID=A0A4R6U5I0_9BACI|nr:ribosomal protein S18 acetylase RimI-like enzyme [Aureibacillus halotolerans]